jgi:hypothetical protein
MPDICGRTLKADLGGIDPGVVHNTANAVITLVKTPGARTIDNAAPPGDNKPTLPTMTVHQHALAKKGTGACTPHDDA